MASDSSLRRIAKRFEKEVKQRREHEQQQQQQSTQASKRSASGISAQQQSQQQNKAQKQSTASEAEAARRAKHEHDAVSTLRKHRTALKENELEQNSGVPLSSDEQLRQAVRSNEKVHVLSTGELKYKPYLQNVHNKEELAKMLHSYPDGLTHNAIEDAYDGAIDDVHSLANEKRAIVVRDLSMHSKQNEVVYPPEPSELCLRVEEDVQQLFRSFMLPHDEIELKQALSKAGIDPAPRRSRSVYRPSNDSRKRMRRQSSSGKKSKEGCGHLRSLQNSHVLDLLTDNRSPSHADAQQS